MSRYEDDYRRRRHRSPDYAYAGNASHLPPDDPTPAPSPPPPPPPAGSSTSRQLLADEPYFSPPPTEPSNLRVPPDPRERPRSLPPPQRSSGSRRYRRDAYDDDADYYDDDYYDGDFVYGSSRGRGQARDRDLDRDRDRDRDPSKDHDPSDRRDKSPMSKAQLILKDNFTDSTVGLGAGMLGALVGGLAAREAVDATSRHGNRRSSRAEAEAAKRNQAIATAVGAAMGALGANALGKRFEASREQQQQQQERGSRRRSGSRADSTGYGSPKGGFDVIERRELVRRPRSGEDDGGGGAWDKDRDWADRRRESRGSGRGTMAREVDPDARSWRSVEEWVYDDRNDPPARRLEEGRYW